MANSPVAYLYSVKRGYQNAPPTYHELVALWPPREGGVAFVAEASLQFIPYDRKIVLSKVRLDKNGNPVEQKPAGKPANGYGRSGGPRQAPADEGPPEDDSPPF